MKKILLVSLLVVLAWALSSCTILVQPAQSQFASYAAIDPSTIELYGATIDFPQQVTVDATCTDAGQSYKLYLEGNAYLNQQPSNVILHMLNGDTFNTLTIYCSFSAVNSTTGRYVRLHY